MFLYGATALVDGKPTGTFLLARDNDEAVAKASSRLPKGGRLTHVVTFCEATPGNLHRNKLYEYCPDSDKVEYACDTILKMVQAMSQMNNALRQSIDAIHDVVKTQFNMRKFAFVVVEASGIHQNHNCFHFDLEQATVQAEKFAKEEYGEGAKLANIEEIQ